MNHTPEKIDRIPLSINFRKLQRYNLNYFSLDEVVLFEYLIVLAQNFGHKQFYHSQTVIEKETGLKRSRQEKIIRKFKDKRILQVEVKGMPKVKWFTLDFEVVNTLLPVIYKCVEDNNLKDGFHKILTDYYKQLVENSKKSAGNNLQENINKNTKERITEDKGAVVYNVDRLGGLPFVTAWFTKAWKDWMWYHKEKNRKLAESTITQQLSLLSKYPEQVAVAMINQSIAKNWAGLFEVKPDQVNKLAPKPPRRGDFWNETEYIEACRRAGIEPEEEIQPESYSGW